MAFSVLKASLFQVYMVELGWILEEGSTGNGVAGKRNFLARGGLQGMNGPEGSLSPIFVRFYFSGVEGC